MIGRVIAVFTVINTMALSVKYDSIVSYPLINTSSRVAVTGSREVSEAGIINFTQICNNTKNAKYDCNLAIPVENNGITGYQVDLRDARENYLFNPLYRYILFIDTFKKSQKISDMTLYSSARPTNGLMDWDYRLLDTAVRTFVGAPLNRKALAKCYVEAQSDAKGCVVQTGKVNGVNYTVSVNFLYFTDDASGDKRNFSLKIRAN